MNVSNNIFSYKKLPEEVKINQSKILKHIKSIKSIKLSKFKISGHELSCTLDFTKWGPVWYSFYANYTRAIVYKTKSNREYSIKIFDNPI